MGAKGSFRNTTVKGQITGFGLDLGIIDDPMKGRAEAQSKTTRDRTWEWLVDDFFSRFSKDAGMIMIMTRWHVDDPIGRWLEYFPKTKVLKYSAIADSADDWTVKAGYRKVGEELFPQWKPYDFLMERKQLMAIAGWESEYQQNPIVAGGDVFPIERLEVIQSVERSKIMSSIRYFDKAGTEGAGASTAGVLMHRMADGSFVVEDVIRGQWGALERERRIKQAANADQALCPGNYEIWVEQEPGSGGKESAESTVRNLAGFNAYADRVSGKGSKEIRAEPFAAQVQNGNVKVKSFDGIAEYFNELEAFPGSKNKDQVDASSGAFNKLIAGTEYDITGSWIGDLESLIPRRSVY
jgi:predicted phage terminase large subunit-like protein